MLFGKSALSGTMLYIGYRVYDVLSTIFSTNFAKIIKFASVNLSHCRLNELPHSIYWKGLISILGMSGYMI